MEDDASNLGKSGRYGPYSIGSHYRGKDHDGQVTLTSGTQQWTVPYTGYYRIDASGAAGGYDKITSLYHGRGARMIGTFRLSKGERIQILVGQEGGINRVHEASGGGGGTFVVRGGNTPFIVAGEEKVPKGLVQSTMTAMHQRQHQEKLDTARGQEEEMDTAPKPLTTVIQVVVEEDFTAAEDVQSTLVAQRAVAERVARDSFRVGWVAGPCVIMLMEGLEGCAFGTQGGAGGGGGYSRGSSGDNEHDSCGGGGGSYNVGSNQYKYCCYTNTGHGRVIIRFT